jgi:hypothetical protein
LTSSGLIPVGQHSSLHNVWFVLIKRPPLLSSHPLTLKLLPTPKSRYSVILPRGLHLTPNPPQLLPSPTFKKRFPSSQNVFMIHLPVSLPCERVSLASHSRTTPMRNSPLCSDRSTDSTENIYRNVELSKTATTSELLTFLLFDYAF